jgi:CheY-like chemotaxis protein
LRKEGESEKLAMSGLTILTAEDNPDDVLLLRTAWRRAGATGGRLCIVADGEEAIGYLSGAGDYADRAAYPMPDLMLLDLNMPRKTGFEVLEWMHRQPMLNNLPVIVFTSSRRERDIQEAYQRGAAGYLAKPGDFNELVEIVRALTDSAPETCVQQLGRHVRYIPPPAS